MELLKDNQILDILQLSSLPAFLKENVVYKSDNPLDFFIGFIDLKEKLVEREVTLITPGISLPIIQNIKISRTFKVNESIYNGKEPIVIILSDIIEYADEEEDKISVPRIILGIFQMSDLKNVLEEDYENKILSYRDEL